MNRENCQIVDKSPYSDGENATFWRPDEVKTLRIRSFGRLHGLVPSSLESDFLIGEAQREILELAIAVHTGNDAGPGDIPENMTYQEARSDSVADQTCGAPAVLQLAVGPPGRISAPPPRATCA
jgi:hypothetical protein